MGLLNAIGMIAGKGAAEYGKAGAESYAEQVKQLALQAREENMARINDQYASAREEKQRKATAEENMVNRAAGFTVARENREHVELMQDRSLGSTEKMQDKSIGASKDLQAGQFKHDDLQKMLDRANYNIEKGLDRENDLLKIDISNQYARDLQEQSSRGQLKNALKILEVTKAAEAAAPGTTGKLIMDLSKYMPLEKAISTVSDGLSGVKEDKKIMGDALAGIIRSNADTPITPALFQSYLEMARTAAPDLKLKGVPPPPPADPIGRAIKAVNAAGRGNVKAPATETGPSPSSPSGNGNVPFLGLTPQEAPLPTPEEIAAEKAAEDQAKTQRRGLLKGYYGGPNDSDLGISW